MRALVYLCQASTSSNTKRLCIEWVTVVSHGTLVDWGVEPETLEICGSQSWMAVKPI